MAKLTIEEIKRMGESVARALAQFRAGSEVTASCIFCSSPLQIYPLSEAPMQTNFDIRCACGRSNTRQLGI